jgi:hypothetical protein
MVSARSFAVLKFCVFLLIDLGRIDLRWACQGWAIMDDERRRRYAAEYRVAHRERLRLAAVAYRAGVRGRPGQPPKYPSRDAAARAKREQDRLYKASPRRVAEAWYREQFRLSAAEVLFSEGVAAHEAWLLSLDDLDGDLPL